MTAFAFSLDNGGRPETERRALSMAFADAADAFCGALQRDGVRFVLLGSLTGIVDEAAQALLALERTTAGLGRFTLRLAVGHSGRADIRDAMRAVIRRVSAGELGPSEITIEMLHRATAAALLPDPTLLVRSGGQARVSDFLLFQLAHTRIAVSETLWPDMTTDEFVTTVRESAPTTPARAASEPS